MFEPRKGEPPREELARLRAWLDTLIEHPADSSPDAEKCGGWVGLVQVGARVQNQAAAAQLVAIGQLFIERLADSDETELWAIDTMAAVAAEVAAGLRISQGLASSKIRYARAMRERLPQVGAVFAAGEIDFATFAALVYRTDNIEDPQILARVDELLALNVTRWPGLSPRRLAARIDKIVARLDLDALRRRRQRHQDREIYISEDHEGICEIDGTLATPDARALDARLSALAATVCPHDPRTHAQRRADALGALAAGATALGCRCARADCTATDHKPPAPVVIHVIADAATLNGSATTPAVMLGAQGLITPELLTELALNAKHVPLIHPGFTAAEPRYRPSAALADYVRARDLTCRWPGCEVPAHHCQLDHTIPYAQGGPTHATNLKCYCSTHHLVKTFWGWTDHQLPDATLILTSPTGDTYVTTPGSALLFPSLCHAVGGMPTPETALPPDYCGERTAMMPKRRRTRAQDRTTRIKTERRQNHQARTKARQTPLTDYTDTNPTNAPCNDPPPF